MAFSSLFAGLSVMSGAFGSHVLKSVLSEYKLDVFNKAAYYLLTHSIAVILLLLVKNTLNLRIYSIGIYAIFAGMIIFSSSLYLTAFSELPGAAGLKLAGAVAPAGGVLMIAGWILTAVSLFKPIEK